MSAPIDDETGRPARATRVARSDELTDAKHRKIRDLLDAAFSDDGQGFTAADWEHALGGVHAIVEADGRIVAHAAVVERVLEVDGRPVRTGYVEAVATLPGHERRGHASAAMRAIQRAIEAGYELGALSSGVPALYERLGWEPWRGPTFVRMPGGPERTPDDDDSILVWRTPRTPALDLARSITCDWQTGDVW